MTRSAESPPALSGRPFREARVDLDALRANMRMLGSDYVVDLSGDAYGHGFVRVAAAALDSGASRFKVGDAAAEELLRRLARDRDVSVELVDESQDSAAVYGMSTRHELRSVMRLSAMVISTKRLSRGDPVSYGYTWRAPRATTLALVGIGYSDGISRRASNRGTAVLDGVRPIVGRIAMDVLSLDIGDDVAEPGDEVIIFGTAAANIHEWASTLDVPALSVTAGVGPRVERVFVDGSS